MPCEFGIWAEYCMIVRLLIHRRGEFGRGTWKQGAVPYCRRIRASALFPSSEVFKLSACRLSGDSSSEVIGNPQLEEIWLDRHCLLVSSNSNYGDLMLAPFSGRWEGSRPSAQDSICGSSQRSLVYYLDHTLNRIIHEFGVSAAR
jgi:hypothetical protein